MSRVGVGLFVSRSWTPEVSQKTGVGGPEAETCGDQYTYRGSILS